MLKWARRLGKDLHAHQQHETPSPRPDLCPKRHGSLRPGGAWPSPHDGIWRSSSERFLSIATRLIEPGLRRRGEKRYPRPATDFPRAAWHSRAASSRRPDSRPGSRIATTPRHGIPIKDAGIIPLEVGGIRPFPSPCGCIASRTTNGKQPGEWWSSRQWSAPQKASRSRGPTR